MKLKKNEMKLKFNEVKQEKQLESRQEYDNGEVHQNTSNSEKDRDSSSHHGKKKQSHKQIHGPYRLMRLLPHASRPIVRKMLQIDPHKRATLEEIMGDEFIREIKCCTLKNSSTLTMMEFLVLRKKRKLQLKAPLLMNILSYQIMVK